MKDMFSLLHHQVLEIKHILKNMYDKRTHVASPINYARALQLFYMTLRSTQRELESIYFAYVLKPQLQAQKSIAMSCIYLMSEMLRFKALDQIVVPADAPDQCPPSSINL